MDKPEKTHLSKADEIKGLIQFLIASPTSWHTGDEARRIFVEENGFQELKENEKWHLLPGHKYFVARDISTFMAFVLPHSKPENACILGAHTDSPGLKLKPNCEKKVDNATLLVPEVYGSPILPSYIGRNLTIAGRVIYLEKNSEEPCMRLVQFNETVAVIPNLAIHLERSQKEKIEINAQNHLPAVAFLNSDCHFDTFLKKLIPATTILSHELFLVPKDKPEIIHDEILNSPRLDNLLGTHASIQALLNSQEPETNQLKAVVCWDHEETGSNSYNGASSNFLDNILERIAHGLEMSFEDIAIFKAQSCLISVDAAHGKHPNYPDKHEPHHAPLIGKGIVIKHHANQSYATNALTSSWIINTAGKCNVPVQHFCTRSDAACGSTIGNIAAPRLGIPTVDIGSPIWGMHAATEVGSLLDHIYMCKLLTQLLVQR